MDTISKYFELVSQRPDLFTESQKIEMILDETQMRNFAQTSGRCMGVVYDNSPYYLVVADLCRNNNVLFSYARIVYCNPESNGAVAIPYCNGKLGLLTIFRHAPRVQTLEFPRGFAEKRGLTPEENIRKELSEELGMHSKNCTVTLLGDVRADSGLCSGKVQIFLAEFTSVSDVRPSDEEGISGFSWVSEKQFREMISSGVIEDGYTMAAYAKLICHRGC